MIDFSHPMAVNVNSRSRLAELQKIGELQDLKGKKIIDVGCGLGFFSRYFANQGAQVLSVDIDELAVAFVRDKLKLDARRINIEEEALPEGEFDVVFLGEVLEHATRPAELIAKLAARVRKGGILIVTTPAMEGWMIDTEGKRLAHHHGSQKHERDGFYRNELDQMMGEAGLTPTFHKYCLFTVAELFMQLTKLAFLKIRRQYTGQSDVLATEKGLSFRLWRLFFPLAWLTISLETSLSHLLKLKGHCHVVAARR